MHFSIFKAPLNLIEMLFTLNFFGNEFQIFLLIIGSSLIKATAISICL